jgi:triosephosphate isomerase
MRKPYVAGNWKMNKTIAESVALATELREKLPRDAKAQVAVIPQFLALSKVAEVLESSPIGVGAQDVFYEKNGAFTGEISREMLRDAGATFALVGHSERRHVIGETDAIVRKKLEALLGGGLEVILCIGEKLEEREAGKTEERLTIQTRAGLQGLAKSDMTRVTIAYEPVWAIGTGRTATTAQAEQAHLFVRGLVEELFDREVAQGMRIQYGGSVKADNAAELMGQPNVDGALVGGAALLADSFLGIVKGA